MTESFKKIAREFVPDYLAADISRLLQSAFVRTWQLEAA